MAVNNASIPDRRAEYVKGLRALAELLAVHPDLSVPHGLGTAFTWNVWPSQFGDDVPAEVARIRQVVGGQWAKNDPADGENGYDASYFTLSRPLYGITLRICSYREAVCERVVTGTREVVEDVPVAFEKRTKTVEDVRWDCKPLLAEVTA